MALLASTSEVHIAIRLALLTTKLLSTSGKNNTLFSFDTTQTIQKMKKLGNKDAETQIQEG
jgi:hypothetical protein